MGADSRVDLDPSERAGILTHASVLALNAYADEPSIIHRGKFVRERLLCQTLPPPPDGIDLTQPNRLDNPTCKGCHTMMDPIGVGFDDYDAIGRRRSSDARGEVRSSNDDVTGFFDGAVDLARRFAASNTVPACVATQMVRFSFRREESSADACSRERIVEAFARDGYKLRDLIIAIATSYEFWHRRPVQ